MAPLIDLVLDVEHRHPLAEQFASEPGSALPGESRHYAVVEAARQAAQSAQARAIRAANAYAAEPLVIAPLPPRDA